MKASLSEKIPELQPGFKKSALAGNLGMLFVSLFISLFLIESGFRAQDLYLNFKYPGEKSGIELLQYDPVLGWKNSPNLKKYYTSKKDWFRIQVKTNSKGLRDKEYPYEKKPGVRRILLLGDS